MTQRGKSASCVIMQMDPKTLCVSLDKQLPAGVSHDEISQTLHSIAECRYVIFHFAYKTPDDQERTKSVYLLWAPSGAPLKQRTVYAAFNSHVRTKLEGVSFELQASDVSELVHEDVRPLICT
jgi:cofilin